MSSLRVILSVEALITHLGLSKCASLSAARKPFSSGRYFSLSAMLTLTFWVYFVSSTSPSCRLNQWRTLCSSEKFEAPRESLGLYRVDPMVRRAEALQRTPKASTHPISISRVKT